MNYGALNAKIKAMGAKLLKSQDFEAIAHMQIEEITEWLGILQKNPRIAINQPLISEAKTDIETFLHQTIQEAANRICLHIHNKNLRNYIELAASPDERNISYYTTQWKRLARLDKANHQALRCGLGAEIDLTNILWMYRLKRFRRIKGGSTYGYLIPIRYRLSRIATQIMADCETPKALLEEVAKGHYAMDIFAVQHQNPKAYIHDASHERYIKKRLTPEQQLTNAINRRNQISARRYPDSLAPAIAYLYKRKLEAQRIIAAITGKTIDHDTLV